MCFPQDIYPSVLRWSFLCIVISKPSFSQLLFLAVFPKAATTHSYFQSACSLLLIVVLKITAHLGMDFFLIWLLFMLANKNLPLHPILAVTLVIQSWYIEIISEISSNSTKSADKKHRHSFHKQRTFSWLRSDNSTNLHTGFGRHLSDSQWIKSLQSQRGSLSRTEN